MVIGQSGDNYIMEDIIKKAVELHRDGKLDEAENLYKNILTNEPDNINILYNLGLIYNVKNDYVNEIKVLEKAVQISNYDYEIYFMLGLAYKNILEFEKAEKAYAEAIKINPSESKTYYNLAIVYLSLNQPQKAIENFKKCIEINPDDVEAKYFLSLAYFRIKDYSQGEIFFENRLCRDTAIKTQLAVYPNIMQRAKLWQGEDISDKILYTYYEAGFGDMIMFARYLPELRKRCKKLIVKPQRELYQLFKENFPDIEFMDFFAEEKNTNFDYHIPFLSIPYVLGLNNTEIFIGHNGYLKADEDKTKYFKEKYFNNYKFKIAIKWQGNTYYETDRVIDVDAFAPLFDLPNTKIYSAQTFEGAENLTKLSDKYDITDLSPDFKDFSYTAGALANVDLVISSDSSLAHVAGAMGIPCIVLLPYNYNWRWHMDLNKCDWYDSVKLYRLGKTQTWVELVKEIVKQIVK